VSASSQTSRFVALIGFSTIIVILLVVSFGGIIDFNDDDEGITSLYNYGEVTDFTLPSVDGSNYTFSSDDGKIRILTFIYTKCMQGCYTLSLTMSALFERLEQETLLDTVKLVSIDFDYIFDNMTDLQTYASVFSDSTDEWQFVLGSQNQTDQVAKDWNFDFQLQNTTANDMETTTTTTEHDHVHDHEVVYLHAFITYVIDQNGNLRKYLWGKDWTVDEAIKTIEFLIEENQTN
jgi:cytochrome oxidase Cu insertion factor (SCO1/SenC/PrrC family)